MVADKTSKKKHAGSTNYRTPVTIIAILIIVGILGMILGIEINRSGNEKIAAKLYELETVFAEWQDIFDAENPDSSDNPNADEVLKTLSQISFPNGSYADNRRNYLIAEIHRLIGEHNTAAEYFLRTSDSARGYLAASALLNAALSYEAAGNVPKTRELLLKLSENYEYPEEPRVLFSLGRLAEAAGDHEEALQFYNQLIDNYTSSSWINLAYDRIILLESSHRHEN